MFDVVLTTSDSDYMVNGFVTVSVGDKDYVVGVVNNTGLLNISGLGAGYYPVNVVYAGDSLFNAKEVKYVASLTVNKVDVSSIVVNVDSPIYVGEDALFDIVLTTSDSNHMVNGYVSATVGGNDYIVSIVNNTGLLNISGLSEGYYPVSIIYNGDNQFNAKYVRAESIVVNKINVTNIDVKIDSPIYVGQNSTINITLKPVKYTINGYVSVNVENKNYEINIINNTGSLTLNGLNGGNYSINVKYYGDNIFNPKNSQTASLTVNKIPTKITMDNIIMNVGDLANIAATINNTEATGSVVFTVNNKEYTVGIVEGVAKLNITGLNTSANRTITAKYSGDYKFTNSSTTATLDIRKVNANATISTHNITAGEIENIIINLPKDITNATITVKFNNNEINDYVINNNIISFNKTLQVAGTYEVSIEVKDDCKYNNFHNSTAFTVSKVNASSYNIIIDVNDTKVFENIPILVILPADANETLSLSVDNTLINGTVMITDGIAAYDLGSLNYGNHTINITYGNDKYADKTVTANVFVAKIASNITIIAPEDARVAHSIIVNIIPEGSTGNINVTINDKEYAVVNRSVIDASELLEGVYTVIVKLDADENYLESTNTTTFTVSRNNVEMTLNNISSNVLVDSPVVLSVNLTENVTGTIVFNVNGMNYTVNITGSDYAEYTWIPTNECSVTVSASYSGNDTYYPCISNEKVVFNVSCDLVKFNEILVNDIMVGDNEDITVSLNATDVTGVILVNINGTIFEANVLGGLAFLTIPDLQAGDYKVDISYPGDRKYYPIDSFITDFTVSKYNSPIDITAEDIQVLDDATVTVTLPSEINDLVTITVGNNAQNIILTNGSASWTISDLPADIYEIIVNYDGNSKFLANNSVSSFMVSKYNSTFNINASDSYWNDENITISVELSDDAEGNVTVIINGTEYTLPVNDGNVNLNIPQLGSGDYEASVIYSGDYKYDSESYDFNFTVNSNYPIISSEDIVKYYKGSERLRVNLTNSRGDKLANETLYIVINDVTYTRVTNENGSFSIAINLLSGEYDAKIIYNTSEIYDSTDKIVNVVVLPTIVSNDLIKVYRNASQFYAYFTDSEGNALTNTSIQFNINGVLYNRTTNASGWAKLNINLPQGEYIITSYNPITGETCGNVVHVLSKITENYDITMAYRDGTRFTVCIIGDDGNHVGAGENVTFNINGVFYTRTTNATGYVGLNINLPEGKYIITTYYKTCSESNTITVFKNGGL